MLLEPPEHPFPPVSYRTWREGVAEELGEASFESLVARSRDGLRIRPLYVAEDLPGEPDGAGFPGLNPFARGTSAAPRAWTIAQEYAQPSAAAAHRALRSDIEAGVEMLWLHPGPEGIALVAPAELETLLGGVELGEVQVVLEAGAAPELAESLLAAAAARGVAADLRGNFGHDPLAVRARRRAAVGPELGPALAALAELARERAPSMRSTLVSTRVYHEAGATAVQELAFALATGVDYLRHLGRADFPLEAAAEQLGFAFCLGSDLFLEIAKLRAARLLWSKALRAAGVSPRARGMLLHALGSRIGDSVANPWTNQLRATAQLTAAALGGAASVAILAYDRLAAEPSDLGRRVALHAQHILAEEAHLGRPADPARGSYFVEALTDELARAAWELFRRLEAAGGMGRALAGGEPQAWVRQAAAERREALARRREVLVGVSAFPNLGAASLVPAAPPERGAAERDELPRQRWAEPFEDLRRRGEALARRLGRRPRAYLARSGERSEHGPRVDFVAGALAVAGIEAVGEESLPEAEAIAGAFADSGAELAVLATSDERWPALLPALAPLLRRAGARRVLLAGRPLDEPALEGLADHYLFSGCDLAATLGEILAGLEEEG